MGNHIERAHQLKEDIARATRTLCEEIMRVDTMPETTELERVRKLAQVRDVFVAAMVYASVASEVLAAVADVEGIADSLLERLNAIRVGALEQATPEKTVHAMRRATP